MSGCTSTYVLRIRMKRLKKARGVGQMAERGGLCHKGLLEIAERNIDRRILRLGNTSPLCLTEYNYRIGTDM